MCIHERQVTLDAAQERVDRSCEPLVAAPPHKGFREFLRTPLGRRGILDSQKIIARVRKQRELLAPSR
jgi:hypothetical protein